jgi:hypothetical protein
MLGPRGQGAAGLERSLQMLGPADASGRRRFQCGGLALTTTSPGAHSRHAESNGKIQADSHWARRPSACISAA